MCFTLLIQLLSAELTHLRLVWPFKMPFAHQWSTDGLVVLLNDLKDHYYFHLHATER